MDTLSQHKLVDSKLRSNNNGEARYSCAPRTKLCLISAPGLLNQQTCTTLYYSFAYYTFCWAVQRWHTTLFEIPAFLLNEAVHEVGEAAIFRSNNTLPWIPTVIYRKIYLIAHAWKRHYDVISKNNLVARHTPFAKWNSCQPCQLITCEFTQGVQQHTQPIPLFAKIPHSVWGAFHQLYTQQATREFQAKKKTRTVQCKWQAI